MTSRETLPEHLTLLSDEATGRWALWRTFCVRGAGFPASHVLRIADAGCAAAADRLNVVEEEAETLRQAALEALRGELEGAAKDRLDVLIKAIRKVKRSQPASTEGLAAATAAAIEAWKEAAGRVAAEKERYQAEFAAAEERLDRELREVAQDERFREAVVWQNRHAAATGLESFLRRTAAEPGRLTARDRGHVQMLASYLQRYCTKNDTIGFFGPVGWGKLVDGDEVIAARPGKDLLATRQVYFEGWAIDAIADRIAEDEAMRPWLAPRRSPYLRYVDDAFVAPNGQVLQLGPVSKALVAACDGSRSAGSLISELGAGLSPDKVEILWRLLADMQANGLLRWGFQVPLSPTPERSLRELLLEIGEEPLRERALELLDEVVAARDAVIRATGNAKELESALNQLEAVFTRATSRAATRGDGQLYAGRTLVYEDCRRDLELELGEPFLSKLAPPLSLVLASARWFSHYLATQHRDMFTQAYAELSLQSGPTVDFLAFSRLALPRLLNIQTNAEVERELQSRWEKVLVLPEGQRRVAYRSEDLLPQVLQEFAAPRAGWQKARCHSPDVLVAASSLDAIRQGDYQVILGEIHLAINTLDRWVFFAQHPEPEKLRAAIESDLPEPSLIPLFAKVWNEEEARANLGMMAPAVSGRMDVALRSAKDYYLDFSLDPHGFPAEQVLPIGDLVIEPGENGLIVRPRDGRVQFDIIEFYQLPLLMQVLATFRILPGGDYTPRVTIDHLVVARESWKFPANVLEFVQAPTAAERFAGARRWVTRRELPRFVFAKTPGEEKPFYLDFESPVLVEIFAKAVRSAAESNPEGAISISEMLPGHDQTWLPDAQGNSYTSELRMVAIDLG
ncbi:MAG TPA: lantibiotic dehydratase [Thermoanaerobaculia bacterium]|nr:lantibiotic dehydratase [Thermoanaerobaculia bacterium]